MQPVKLTQRSPTLIYDYKLIDSSSTLDAFTIFNYMDKLENYLVKFKHKLTSEILYLRQYDPSIRQWYDSDCNKLKTIEWNLLREYDEVDFDSIDQYQTILSGIDGYGYDPIGKLGAEGIYNSDDFIYVIVDKDFPYFSYDNIIYPFKTLAERFIKNENLTSVLKVIPLSELKQNRNSRYVIW